MPKIIVLALALGLTAFGCKKKSSTAPAEGSAMGASPTGTSIGTQVGSNGTTGTPGVTGATGTGTPATTPTSGSTGTLGSNGSAGATGSAMGSGSR